VIATVYNVYSRSLVIDAKISEERRNFALVKAFHLLVNAENDLTLKGYDSDSSLTALKSPIFSHVAPPTVETTLASELIDKEYAYQKTVLSMTTCNALLAKLRPHYTEAKLEVVCVCGGGERLIV
jgi:hypothetical protein